MAGLEVIAVVMGFSGTLFLLRHEHITACALSVSDKKAVGKHHFWIGIILVWLGMVFLVVPKLQALYG